MSSEIKPLSVIEELQNSLSALKPQCYIKIKKNFELKDIEHIAMWNDCRITKLEDDYLEFYKRTPPLPTRLFNQESIMNSMPTITQKNDLQPVDPDGNPIYDISGYLMSVPSNFVNLRR